MFKLVKNLVITGVSVAIIGLQPQAEAGLITQRGAASAIAMGFSSGKICDVNFASVSGLYHFDGANGSTGPFTDSSLNGNNLTSVNSAGLSNVTEKFGTASLLLTRSMSQNATLADTGTFQMGAGNFTIEGWLYLNTIGINQTIWSKSTSGSQVFEAQINTANKVLFYLNNVAAFTSSTALTTGTWYALAFTRSGTTVTMWLNGVSDGTGTSSANVSSGGNAFLFSGTAATGANFYIDGYEDEWRVTKGVSRYSGSYTPTGPFPNC